MTRTSNWMLRLAVVCLVLAGTMGAGCKEVSVNPENISVLTDDDNSDNNNGTDLPAGYEKFAEGVEVYAEGEYIVVRTNGLPNHGSPYYDQSHALFGFKRNKLAVPFESKQDS